MLAIRLQRLGRKRLPIYRLAVQEAQRHPSSGRVVAYVGTYNPHTKEVKLDTEKVETYLSNGAQPTPRVVRILKDQKVKLPSWVKVPADKKRDIKHAEKLRKNRPAEPEAPAAEAPSSDTPAEDTPAEVSAEPADTKTEA